MFLIIATYSLVEFINVWHRNPITEPFVTDKTAFPRHPGFLATSSPSLLFSYIHTFKVYFEREHWHTQAGGWGVGVERGREGERKTHASSTLSVQSQGGAQSHAP